MRGPSISREKYIVILKIRDVRVIARVVCILSVYVCYRGRERNSRGRIAATTTTIIITQADEARGARNNSDRLIVP